MTVGESSWAVLCLAGLAALDAEPSANAPESPAGEATPSGTYAVDCQEIADRIVQARAERERREASTRPRPLRTRGWSSRTERC
ncbi:hypothetical protein ACWEQO_02595 [Streptomyces sp. NPDC004051]